MIPWAEAQLFAAQRAQLAAEVIRPALARFKHPRRMLILPELPRNTMGKVQKAALRTQHSDTFAP